jgi:quinoprotein relay system zinc metallohydrolase 1
MNAQRLVGLVLYCLLLSTELCAQARPDVQTLDYRLTAQQIAPGVYVVEGANADFSLANGCNIINTGFIVTGGGVVVVNTGPSKRYGEQLRRLIARTTSEPIARVIHLNLHPDYFLGNQAFADVPRYATENTRTGMAREAKSYEDNLYRLCGEWMKGTEAVLPDQTIAAGLVRVGNRDLELQTYDGHTDSDLVLIDKTSGVMFVGGLVFAQRVPTTPHAHLDRWQLSLNRLSQFPPNALMVPSHGPFMKGRAGLSQTQRYLRWIDDRLSRSAKDGLEINEILRLPVPAEYGELAAFETEYVRNVTHLYPQYESRALRASR